MQQLDRRQRLSADDTAFLHAADDTSVDTSTDYSKYTDYTDDEGWCIHVSNEIIAQNHV